ncbi:MAG: flagellar assembly peptidoglycan hydrolase FlgJ, partial [Nevskiales bacterium]
MAASDISAAATATDFSQLAALRTAAKRNDPQALHKAAQQFEALFTEMLLKSSDQTKFGDDLTGQQGEFYKDLYNQQMALHLSSGKGLGLADMLVRQLNGLHGGSTPPTHAPPPSSATGPTSDADNWQPKSAQDFVDTIRPHAEKAAAELGVPARALIAQAALETGWGQHMAKQKDGSSGLNLFGVKAQGGWTGASRKQQTSEYENGQLTNTRADFRSYNSIGAAFDDYVKVLKSNPRYADALRSGDVHGFAQALQKAGYATDPHYAQKLVKVAYGTQMNGSYT